MVPELTHSVWSLTAGGAGCPTCSGQRIKQNRKQFVIEIERGFDRTDAIYILELAACVHATLIGFTHTDCITRLTAYMHRYSSIRHPLATGMKDGEQIRFERGAHQQPGVTPGDLVFILQERCAFQTVI